MEKYNFQFCPKIVVFSANYSSVLLCRRKGEQDYDGTFSFIGGKMEITDNSIIEGLNREKNEEVGANFKIRLYPKYSANLFFLKKDGSRMILPHYAAVYATGEVQLNEEYSEYRWVPISELESFEPKIKNIPVSVAEMLALLGLSQDEELVEI